MKMTTVCYIRGQEGILMLHRTKKKIDINKNKWIGVGGKMIPGESPAECIIREVKEETGLTIKEPRLSALITYQFIDPAPETADWESEYMFVFTADKYEGQVNFDCPEGDLCWFPQRMLPELNMWEGDALFLPPVLGDSPFFSMKMTYRGDELVSWSLD
ncbi:MAG TPA: DNA mismatch repair protein MutT [Lachnospiraceae bacterium]|jgi:8-oxo-dGTP diphosphatase|nr:DNA mismatch repair protein MutT [Lachnospiraceae bacterium]